LFDEVATMNRLAPRGLRPPINARYTTEQDRQTHRRWARVCYISTSAMLVALLAVCFVIGRQLDPRIARDNQMIGDTMSAFVSRFTPGINHP
jgi:hypothetical protein